MIELGRLNEAKHVFMTVCLAWLLTDDRPTHDDLPMSLYSELSHTRSLSQNDDGPIAELAELADTISDPPSSFKITPIR